MPVLSKKWIWGGVAIMLLAAGCKLVSPGKKTGKAEPAPMQTEVQTTLPDMAAVVKELPAAEPEFVLEPVTADTLIKIEGKAYHLKLEALPDTADKLTFVDRFLEGGETRTEEYAGINCNYTVTLTDTQGKKVFSRRLTKKDYWDRVYKGIVIAADPDIPQYLGYSKPFRCLLFSHDFLIPESDWGTQCFFMLDLQGGLKEISESNNFGGGDIDCEPIASVSGKSILTCNKILNSRGRTVDLYREDRETVLARFLTDTTVLVIYDYDGARNPKNAQVMKTNGTVLSKFTYRGYYNVMGYEVPYSFLPETNSVYLLDERRAHLQVFSNRDPKNISKLPLRTMAPFRGNKKTTEIKFELETEECGHVFYLDRKTRRFRYQKLLAY